MVASQVGRVEERLATRWLGLLLPAAFALNAVFPILNFDIWFHLKTGELIASTGRIPTTDPFSYTAFGNPWINHEWLFALGAYGLYAIAGLVGLILIKAAIAGTTLWLVQGTVRRHRVSSLLEVEILLLVALAVFPRLVVRPHVLTYLFMAYLVWRLEAFRRGTTRALWELPALYVLWSNVHGGVIFGLAVLGLTTVGEALDAWGARGGWWPKAAGVSGVRLRHLALVTALAALATLANPFTYRLYTFIAEHLFLGEVIQISEHRSVFSLGFFLAPTYWLVVGVAALALVRLWPQRRWAELLVVLCFGLFSMKSHRTTPLFAIVAAPVLAEGLRPLQAVVGGAVRRRAGVVLAAAATLVAVAMGGVFPRHYQKAWIPSVGMGLYERHYPIGAAAFVEKHGLPGPLYNDYRFGGYLIWRWYPERKVFQDGRTLVYDRELLRTIYKVGAETAEAWNALMERYGVRLAVVSSETKVNFTRRFVADRWALVYWDEVAAVLLKRGPAQRRWIDPYGYSLLRPFLTGPEVIAIVRQGRGEALEEELRRHLALHPESSRAKALWGWHQLASGKPADAQRTFEETLDLNPSLVQARWGAARSLEALGQAEAARDHWKRLLRLDAKGKAADEAQQALKR